MLKVGQAIMDLKDNAVGVITEVGSEINNGIRNLNEDTFFAKFHAGYTNSTDMVEIVFEKAKEGIEWIFI